MTFSQSAGSSPTTRRVVVVRLAPKPVKRRCVVMQAQQEHFAEWAYQQPVVTGAMRWQLKYDWACAWSARAAANMLHVQQVLAARRARPARVVAHGGPVERSPPTVDYTMTPLAWCVSGLESSHEFQINTGNGFMGGYQFVPATWDSVTAMMGVSWPLSSDPQDPLAGHVVASEAQQTAAFNYWVARDPQAWPVTVPACGGP